MSSNPTYTTSTSSFTPPIHRKIGREIYWAHSLYKLISEDDDAATYQRRSTWDVVEDKTISTDGRLTFEWFGRIGQDFEFSTHIPSRRLGLPDDELSEADRRYVALQRQLHFACCPRAYDGHTFKSNGDDRPRS